MTKETVDSIVEFHGHMGPDQAMGIRAAEMALERRQLCIPCFDGAMAGTSPVAGPALRRPEV